MCSECSDVWSLTESYTPLSLSIPTENSVHKMSLKSTQCRYFQFLKA